MARPVKWRRVATIPRATYFKPAGVPLRALEDVALSLEEAEAIRLKDIDGLDQGECAKRMRVSRPTFHRVLRSARHKIADALIHGKVLRIGGGNFALDRQPFRCVRDGHEWDVHFEEVVAGRPLACPRCESSDVLAVLHRGRGGGPGRGSPRRRLGAGRHAPPARGGKP